MEDVVPEAESLLHPITLSGDEVIGERQNPEAAKEDGEERADEEKQDKQAEKETVPMPEGGKKDGKGGGILDHIISNLVTPSSPKAGTISQGKVEAFEVRSENESGSRSEEVAGGGGGRGGLINDIVANLFPHSEGEVREGTKEKREEEMVKVDEENRAEKTETGGGGRGIIDNIVSHLPTSLPAPTTDEATILIHIVQD